MMTTIKTRHTHLRLRPSPYIVLPLLLSLLLTTLLCAAPAEAPIQAEPVLTQAPSAEMPLIVTFQFKIKPGVHVYADAEHFFELSATESVNLGTPVLTLPPTTPIPDLLSDVPNATVEVFAGNVSAVVTVPPLRTTPGGQWRFAGTLQFQGCTESSCYPPQTVPFSFSGDGLPITAESAAPPATLVDDSSGNSWASRSLLAGTLMAFLAGLALSLTPCVYPMVGITVAVIGGRGASRRRTLWLTFWYVLGLALVYAAAGVAVALLGQTATTFFNSAWVLGTIGVVFLAMGLSMFDLFSFATPSGIASRLQGVGKQGSVLGVLAMGALSAFVVGPCMSAPLLGLITFVASTGEWLRGFLYFFALAWGIGTILFLAGGAAGLLPKAGAWMEAIKHILGMVLLWAAFYFTRRLIGELAFVTASLTCLGLGLGVLGWLRLPSAEDPPARQWRGWLRLLVATAILAAAIWQTLATWRADSATAPRTIDLALELAQPKPVLLDFTAPWCGNCKVIEKEVLLQPAMQPFLDRYHTVKVDFDRNPELVRRYNITAPPAFLFLDANGTPDAPPIVTAAALAARLRQPPPN